MKTKGNIRGCYAPGWKDLILILFVLLLILFIPKAHADLTCHGFHALLGFAKEKHLREFSPQQHLEHYANGLRIAVRLLEDPKTPLDPAERQRLVTPAATVEEFEACKDSYEIADALSAKYDIQIPVSRVLEMQLKGTLKSMDPHSDYHPAQEWDHLMAMAQSASLGVVWIQLKGSLYVAHVYPEGPADGILKRGDQILTALKRQSNGFLGVRCKDCNPLMLQRFFTGVEGDAFTFEVQRGDQKVVAEVVMSNDPGSRVATAKVLDGGIGYIRLTDFGQGAAADFNLALEKIMQEGASTLAFDLRGNPGGNVAEAVGILDSLLDVGVAVAFEGREGDITSERMTMPGQITDMPVITMVNRFSASAAELVPGALADYERSLILGETTFGKGTAQLVYSPYGLQQMLDPSITGGLRLTMFQYFTPSGNSPQLDGRRPHVEVIDYQLSQEIEKKKKYYESLNYTMITSERDYGNAIPAKSIASQFESGTLPTNALNWILDHLQRGAISVDVGSDKQLGVATSLLRPYRDHCLTFHRNSCDFSMPGIGGLNTLTQSPPPERSFYRRAFQPASVSDGVENWGL